MVYNLSFLLPLYFQELSWIKYIMLNEVIVCLGSNQDKEKNIELAGRLLGDYFVSIHFSDAVYTEPVGLNNSSPFLNQVAIAYTPEEPDSIIRTFKHIEELLGRVPEDKKRGRVPIDIDLLQWNDSVLKPEDLQRSYVRSSLCRLFDTRYKDERSNQ